MSDLAVGQRRPRRLNVPGLPAALPLAVLGILFFYPLALIIAQSFATGHGTPAFANYISVLGSALFRNALWHTITITLAASLGCIALGFTLSVVIAFVPFPGARLLARAIETFIALPTFLVALALTFIYGSAGILNGAVMKLFGLALPPIDFLYSAWGVILAEVTVYTPFVMRPLLAAFSLIEASQIEVASILGAGGFRILRQIILPAALPALMAGGSLCLLLTTNEFGIVLFIGAKGVETLPLLVYDKAIQEFDYASACVFATINIALSLGLYALYRSTLAWFSRAGLV
jgi:2-aminoethylphosphonate transport system permease protein